MGVAQISVLTKNEMELVHRRTLRILEETGISALSQSALDVLERGGAKVDKKSMRAWIPESLVRETIRKSPKTLRLCARNPRQDMPAPKEGPPYMATNGTAVYMPDSHTGGRRATTSKDLGDFMRLCDALDPLDYVWPIVTAHDAPERTHALSELAISLENTTKHVQGEAMSAEEAKAEVEVASEIVGGPDELTKRPIFSVIQCPICPLEFEAGSVEAVMEFAKAGIPVVSMSMALCGLTAPVSLAGTIALVNAENIASFAISQMTKAGAPVVYSSESTAPDMKTGEIHYGALEELLLASAAGQMARYYDIPSMVGGFSTGLAGTSPGIFSNPAELVFTSMTSMTVTDFASGIGGLDQAKGAAFEQVIIDCDMWEQMREMRKVVQLDDAHFVTDLIKQVGPGGTFVKVPHTMRNMRKELFLPASEKADIFATYRLNKNQKGMIEQARARAKKILENHVPEPVEGHIKKKINNILDRFKG